MKAWVILVVISIIILLNFNLGGSNKSKFNNSIKSTEGVKEIPGTCGNVRAMMDEAPDVFKAKCATCHQVDRDATGPALRAVEDHMPEGREYLGLFIRNEDSLIKAKDSYAIRISKSRPINYNHNFSEITPKQLQELILFLQ